MFWYNEIDMSPTIAPKVRETSADEVAFQFMASGIKVLGNKR